MRATAFEEEVIGSPSSRQPRKSVEREQPWVPSPASYPGAELKPATPGLLQRRWGTLVFFTLFAVIIASIALKLITPTYTSSARLIVQRAGMSYTVGSYSSREIEQFLQTEEQIITSTPVLATAIGSSEIGTLDPIRGHGDSIRQLKQSLRVAPGEGQGVLLISCDSAHPRDAARIVSAVVDSYVRFQSGIRGNMADGSQAVVKREQQDAAARFQTKWNQLQQFAREHSIADGHEQVDAADAALHDLAIKLARAKMEVQSTHRACDEIMSQVKNLSDMNERIAKLKEADPTIVMIDDTALQQKLGQLQMTLSSYNARFMSNYPAVQSTRHEIEDIQLERVAIAQTRLDAAIRRQNELESSYKSEQDAAAQNASDARQFESLKNEAAELEAIVHQYDARLRELDPAARALTTSVTILEPAMPADRPSNPKWGFTLAFAALAGLTLGAGVVTMTERRTGTNTATGAMLVGMPLLARLPAVPRRLLSPCAETAAEFAGACRQIQAAIEGIESTAGGITVLITSSETREGKSTLTSLLASTLARTGKRVLLVDANIDSAAQAGIFGIESKTGLANLLLDDASIELNSAVHPTAEDTLDVLPAGQSEEPSEELLNSQRFSNVLASAAAEYDFVLVDSPALSEGSDAEIISASCDATILLAREKNLSRKTLSRTSQDIRNVGGSIVGIVLNGGCEAFRRRERTVEREAFVSVDVSHHRPVPVTVVRQAPPVVQAEVSQILDPSPVVENTPMVEIRPLERPRTPLWSRALLLCIVLGSWATFHYIGRTSPQGMLSTLTHLLSGNTQWLFTLPTVVCGLVVVIILAAMIVRPPSEDIGLLGVVGLLAMLSFKGGATDAIRSVGGSSGAVMLALESVVLFAGLMLVRSVLRGLFPPRFEIAEEPASMGDTLLAMFAQISVMAALVILLSKMSSKLEILVVLGFASCLATMAGSWVTPVGSNRWFWISPLGVALIGYLAAAAIPISLQSDFMHAAISALSHPLPMDYASMGPLGALAGYWIASTGRSDQTSVFVK